jgi:ribosomal protein L28
MSKTCDFSGKKRITGKRIQHHHSEGWRFKAPRTNRVFKTNVREIKVKDSNGKEVKLSIAMKYYKKLRQQKYLDIKEGEKAGRYFLIENVAKKTVA